MIISSADVRKAIKSVWPNLKYVVLSDSEWLLPDIEELRDMVKEVAIDRMSFIPPLFECEEFTMMLVTAVRARRADLATSGKLPREQWRNWPLGAVAGKLFRGVATNHWIGVCVTKQGLYLVEAQTGEDWKPVSGEDDKNYFLWM